MEKKTSAQKTRALVGVALFTAIVVVLQLLGSFIKFGPFSISLVLIPIVVGAAVYGARSGMWLGFVFGVAVLLSGDAAAFLAVNPFGTIVTVLLKGALAGLAAGLVYKLFEKYNRTAAVIAAAFVCPVVNTGIFLLGCLIFFMDTITVWGQNLGFGDNVGKYMIFGLCGGNFLFELGINLILSPLIVRIINIGKEKRIK